MIRKNNQGEYMEIIMEPINIIFPLQGEEVWLAKKTRVIGVGLWNGYGGKLEANETNEEGCVRELKKESLLKTTVDSYKKVAIIDFFIHKNDEVIKLNRCHVYFLTGFEGEPQTTAEMSEPTRFHQNKLPYRQMMADTVFWMPHIFKGENIHSGVHYNEKRTKIIGTIHSRQLKPAELNSDKWNHHQKAVS